MNILLKDSTSLELSAPRPIYQLVLCMCHLKSLVFIVSMHSLQRSEMRFRIAIVAAGS